MSMHQYEYWEALNSFNHHFQILFESIYKYTQTDFLFFLSQIILRKDGLFVVLKTDLTHMTFVVYFQQYWKIGCLNKIQFLIDVLHFILKCLIISILHYSG